MKRWRRSWRFRSATRSCGAMRVCFSSKRSQSGRCPLASRNRRGPWMSTKRRASRGEKDHFQFAFFEMKIIDIRPTTITVPLEAPLRHANGCHWGRFVRTIVEVETDEGLIGLGEMGGGGESAEAVFRAMKSYVVGHDPARIEEMRFLIANPTASLYNNRTQILAALEFACLDILGQKWGVPVSEILGGRLRDRVAFASYLFFRYANPKDESGEVRNADQLVAHAKELKEQHGFSSHKLKGGVFPPEYELLCYRA